MTVVGARPQFVKAAVISRAIARMRAESGVNAAIQELVVHTGQHYDQGMSEVFFRELELPTPAHDLGVGSGPHGQQTGRMLEAEQPVMSYEKPAYVLVFGDRNSIMAGSLAARKLHLTVGHVEAGLRSYNRAVPQWGDRI